MMAAWSGYTDHHNYGDEWQPREARPAPATIPNRANSDPDMAARLHALADRHSPLTAPQTEIWVDTLIEQGRELMDEVISQDLNLYEAYDRIEELADEAQQERDKAHDYRTLLIVLLVALALLWGTRGL